MEAMAETNQSITGVLHPAFQTECDGPLLREVTVCKSVIYSLDDSSRYLPEPDTCQACRQHYPSL